MFGSQRRSKGRVFGLIILENGVEIKLIEIGSVDIELGFVDIKVKISIFLYFFSFVWRVNILGVCHGAICKWARFFGYDAILAFPFDPLIALSFDYNIPTIPHKWFFWFLELAMTFRLISYSTIMSGNTIGILIILDLTIKRLFYQTRWLSHIIKINTFWWFPILL